MEDIGTKFRNDLSEASGTGSDDFASDYVRIDDWDVV